MNNYAKQETVAERDIRRLLEIRREALVHIIAAILLMLALLWIAVDAGMYIATVESADTVLLVKILLYLMLCFCFYRFYGALQRRSQELFREMMEIKERWCND